MDESNAMMRTSVEPVYVTEDGSTIATPSDVPNHLTRANAGVRIRGNPVVADAMVPVGRSGGVEPLRIETDGGIDRRSPDRSESPGTASRVPCSDRRRSSRSGTVGSVQGRGGSQLDVESAVSGDVETDVTDEYRVEPLRDESSTGRTAAGRRRMKVLFDINHPAHVHLFKHAIAELEAAGHDTFVLSRDKEITTTLLDRYEIDHTPLSAMGTRKFSLITEWLKREFRTIRIARSYDPDVILSVASPPAAHAARIVGCPKIVFNDSEPAHLASKLTHPFTDRVCTPANFGVDIGENQVRYDGYHELAYLHPDRFEPDPDSIREHGVEPDDRYSVVRFVSWGAHHDVGHNGLSPGAKRRLVSLLAEHGDVYITSESPLPEEFESYRLPIPPERIHDLLYYADLYAGDSQTMATEAAILGTPAVRFNSFAGESDMGNFLELEAEYGLVYSRSDETEAMELIRELLADPTTKERWQEKRERLIDDKIDVTEYILEQIYELGGTAT